MSSKLENDTKYTQIKHIFIKTYKTVGFLG